MSMLSELMEQPAAVRRCLDANQAQASEFAGLLAGSDHVVIAARGTSDNAARYAQYAWGSRLGLSVGLTAPSLFGWQARPPSLAGAVVVGISQSGESPDLVTVLESAKRQGRPVVVITNHPDSPLGRLGDLVMPLCAGEERAVAATKTYTAQLAAVALCAAAPGAREQGTAAAQLRAMPEVLEEALDAADAVEAAVGSLIDSDGCVVIGRGFHQATVHEWALKLQELTYILAQAYSAADFLHGPVAVVAPGFCVLMVATTGAHLSSLAELSAQLLDRGAHVVALSDEESFPCSRHVAVPKTAEWLAPIAAAPALQLFARSLCVARGLDPDTPRTLSKVTRTR
ncbi:MAG: SIS domain-containing protein [Acidimicrobiaceae bacterium]|nr:SIS domain-containing protein [Acidimicrobiaceae bacterium]MCY4280575.1 SIS domain-containing protein [Acidimicrobiaceae bacterium]